MLCLPCGLSQVWAAWQSLGFGTQCKVWGCGGRLGCRVSWRPCLALGLQLPKLWVTGSHLAWIAIYYLGNRNPRVGIIPNPKPLNPKPVIVEPRKLEHGFRKISARIPYTLP